MSSNMKKKILSLCTAVLTVCPLMALFGNIKAFAFTLAAVQPAAATSKSDICSVCHKASAIPYFCVEHTVIAIVLAVALVLNFIRFKNNIIKMLANSAAVLLLIIVFSWQYTNELFTQSKICLVILALYLVLWIISVIKTVGRPEPENVKRKGRRC